MSDKTPSDEFDSAMEERRKEAAQVRIPWGKILSLPLVIGLWLFQHYFIDYGSLLERIAQSIPYAKSISESPEGSFQRWLLTRLGVKNSHKGSTSDIANAVDNHASASIGILSFASGETWIYPQNSHDRRAARQGDKIFAQDAIEAGANGRLKIVFVDQNTITLSQNSKLNLSEYKHDSKTGGRATLNLLYGTARSMVHEKYQDTDQSHYHVQTPAAVARVRGTDFVTSYNADNKETRIDTLDGIVNFVPENKPPVAIGRLESVRLVSSNGVSQLSPTVKLTEGEVSELKSQTNWEAQEADTKVRETWRASDRTTPSVHLGRIAKSGAATPESTTDKGIWGDVYSIVVKNDDQIFVAGDFHHYGTTAADSIVQLQPDLTLNSKFHPTLSLEPDASSIKSLYVDGVGRIWLSGSFQSMNRQERGHFSRLLANGGSDVLFKGGNGFRKTNFARPIVASDDDRVWIGGIADTYAGVPVEALTRLKSDGSLDKTFHPIRVEGEIWALALDSQKRLWIGGTFQRIGSHNTSYLARLKDDGTLDTSFAAQLSGPVHTLAATPGGAMLIGGVDEAEGYVARVGSDDRMTFPKAELKFDAAVRAIAPLPDESFYVGGDFIYYENAATGPLVHLKLDGNVSEDWKPTTAFPEAITALVIEKGGTLLWGGAHRLNRFKRLAEAIPTPHPQQRERTRRLTRLLEDGRLDQTFSLAEGFSSPVEIVDVENDTRPLLFSPNSKSKLVQVDEAGAATPLESPLLRELNSPPLLIGPSKFMALMGQAGLLQIDLKTQVTNPYSKSLIVPTGHIVVDARHNFWFYSDEMITKLNVDGSISTTFRPADGEIITAFLPSPQGQGAWVATQSSKGIAVSGIARLYFFSVELKANTELRLPILMADNRIRALRLDTKGRLLIGGDFLTIQSRLSPHLARLSRSGQLDTTLKIGRGFDGEVSSLYADRQNRIWVAGDFENYDNFLVSSIFRIDSHSNPDSKFQVAVDHPVSPSIYPADQIWTVPQGFMTCQPKEMRMPLGAWLCRRFQVSGAPSAVAPTKLEFERPVKSLLTTAKGDLYVALAPGKSQTFFHYSKTGVLDPNPQWRQFEVNGSIESLAEDDVGDIWIAGHFQKLRTIATGPLIHLHPNGSLDEHKWLYADSGYDVDQIQFGLDRKLWFQLNANGVRRRTQLGYVAKNSEGVLYLRWFESPMLLESDLIHTFTIDSQRRRIWISAGIRQNDGSLLNRLFALLPDGQRDTTQEPLGITGEIKQVSIKKQGELLLHGSFRNVNGLKREGLALVNAEGVILPNLLPRNAWVKSSALTEDDGVIISQEWTRTR